MRYEDIDPKKMKEKYKPIITKLTYPSVTKRKRPWGAEFWLAVWIQDGIPQHCQCTTEQEGWFIIEDRIGDQVKDEEETKSFN